MFNEKTNQLINEFISEIPENYKEMFKDITDFSMSLGYIPKKTKTKDFALDFSKSKVKKTIMKLEVQDNVKKNGIPGLRLKFYANETYSDIFKLGIKRVIEEFAGKYTGCFGCGKCKGKLEGYTYSYDDGKKVFRCGGELISVHNFSTNDIPEIKKLIKCQDEFFMNNYT